jgi:DNA mismatch endonuclease, patch repair protein
MPDIVDSATRSRMMSGIKAANTRPELRVRRRMHASGLRYRLRSRDLPGRPDLVFRPIRTVVFVHGCFWHQHPGCRYAARPGTNLDFWANKFQENAERDLRVERQLGAMGWTVLVLWECAADEEIDSVVAQIHERRRGRIGHDQDCALDPSQR